MSDSDACRATQALAPELALGMTTGEERARALQHLTSCAECRKVLAELAGVADELLLLAPVHEPPLGFESRVTERLFGKSRRPGRWRAVVAAAAALALAVASAGAVYLATGTDRRLASRYRRTLAVANGEYFTAAPLFGRGDAPVGHVFGYEGSPSWLFVEAGSPLRSGQYRVRVVTSDGRASSVGLMVVAEGRGSWGRTVASRLHDIAFVRLVRLSSGEHFEARLR